MCEEGREEKEGVGWLGGLEGAREGERASE